MFTCINIISLIVIANVNSYTLPKCCEMDSSLKRVNNSFICEMKSTKRHYIITNRIFNKTTNTNNTMCIEWFENTINQFTSMNGNQFFSVGKNLNVHFVHKCCPFGYEYAIKTHSCLPTRNNESEIMYYNKQDPIYVKIGLPHCYLIRDYILNDETDAIDNDDDFNLEYGQYCKERIIDDGRTILRVCSNSTKDCKRMKCIHKCCPDGQSFINGSFCKDTYVYGINFNFTDAVYEPDDEYAIIHGIGGKVIPLSRNFFLDEIGSFHYTDTVLNKTLIYPSDEQIYCIEHARKNKLNSYLFFKNPQPQPIKIKFLILRWFELISCIFLLLTIFIYILIKETDQLFGKILISFCSAIFVTYLLHFYFTFNPKISDISLCKSLAFLIIYMVFATFVWLNIMCLDIYWTFGLSKSGLRQKEDELKQFLFYSLYGWGCPLILISIIIFFHFIDVLPSALRISVGVQGCTIDKKNYAEHVFRFAPLAILQLINVYLFITTIRYCLKVKGEIHKMNDTQGKSKKQKFKANKERLGLIIKLSVVMGITFIFEIVSSFYDFHPSKLSSLGVTNALTWIEIILDSINCCQGVFIFMIFICKKRILDKLRKKISSQPRESSGSAYTRSSNVSATRNSFRNHQKLED